ncbi:unnamed protein product [Linum tenue]|uniref:Remorin n=1 Tax=Linum tenue TaxID=586396 RepID=A0AAV0PIQ9_9ROSI|nr:unnamed protein product [Linum tenue]
MSTTFALRQRAKPRFLDDSMAEQEVKKPEAESPVVAEAPAPPAAVEEKSMVPTPEEAKPEKTHEESHALAVVEAKAPEPVPKKISDVALADIVKEKQTCFIKAWEDTEKSKVNNKAQKEISAISAWENTKKSAVEAKLKKLEEQLEKKKAEYGEKMKNKVAQIHKEAEEKRAMVEAKRGEEFLKAEEMAAKYRATGQVPKKLLGCF